MLVGGDEGFIAFGGEIDVGGLHADRALQLLAAVMRFEPRLPAFAGEARAGLAVAFELGVLVVGVLRAEIEPIERARR